MPIYKNLKHDDDGMFKIKAFRFFLNFGFLFHNTAYLNLRPITFQFLPFKINADIKFSFCYTKLRHFIRLLLTKSQL